MRTFLSLALAAVLAAPAIARADTAWTVDYEASSLNVVGTAFGTKRDASFEEWQADIVFDPDDLPASSIAITIQTESLQTPIPEMTRSGMGEAWFDVENHPTASFVSDSISAAGDGYEATGTLTIKGNAQPVTLPFTVSTDGDQASATGGLTIDRTDFNVGSGGWESPDQIAHEAEISFKIEAAR